MKIYMTHSTYKKENNKWILRTEYPAKEISELIYTKLMYEKWKGDRRQFKYSYEFGQRLMTRLTNTDNELGLKSVRTFAFESEV